MLHESGIQFNRSNLIDRLNQITLAINEQRSFVNARKEAANKYKSLRTRLDKAKRDLDKLLGQRQRLLAMVGAETEEAYRLLETKHEDRKLLMKNARICPSRFPQLWASISKRNSCERCSILWYQWTGKTLGRYSGRNRTDQGSSIQATPAAR